MQLPLEDVKVLDLSHALTGPFCSTMLADYGAQGIKIEPPAPGDIARAGARRRYACVQEADLWIAEHS